MLEISNDPGASFDPASGSCHGRGTWFVAWTHPRRERFATDEINALPGFEAYLPLCWSRQEYQWKAIVPLFPRYVFVTWDEGAPWGEILRRCGRTTSGSVAGLIRHAPSRPTAVPSGVIEALKARTSVRGFVDDPDEQAPTLIPVGAAITVLPGDDPRQPHYLTGLTGIVKLSSAKRCAVLISMMGATVTASIDPANLAVASE